MTEPENPQPGPYGTPPPYGAPQPYGYAPVQPYGYGPPQPAPKPGTNGFAIASFIFGIIGGLAFSIGFGIVGLVQTRQNRQAGRGFAIAGLALSGLWVLGLIAAVALLAANDGRRSSTTRGVVTTTSPPVAGVAVDKLSVGDCFSGLDETDLKKRYVVNPCATPHEAEVFAVFTISGTTYAGDTAVSDQAEKGCQDRFPAYAPAHVDDDSLDLFYFYPSQASWSFGDRKVVCVATDPAGNRKGSLHA